MLKYKFYPSLLDSFQWYLKSEADDAFQEFIDLVNRVDKPKSEAMLKGTALNELLDLDQLPEADYKGMIAHNEFGFKADLVRKLHDYFSGCAKQVFTQGEIETPRGTVLLYGYTDYIRLKVYDLKTTSNYTFPKFLHNLQHLVYPYCLLQEGIDLPEFEYTVTDFSNIYKEGYVFKPDRDIQKIVRACSQLIDFLEDHRELITDKKIFALDA
jgi:hypothetical protein